MTPQTFWMVFVNRRDTPTHRHPSLKAAEEEATRLAKLPDNKGRNVYVLEAVGYCHTADPPVEWTEL